MAGINGGVGGQQPIQPATTGAAQGAGDVNQTGASQKTDVGNLSVSHTEGNKGQVGTSSSPMASIPAPSPEAAQYLSTLNPSDLQALLANLNAEVSQTQDDLAISQAAANKAEVKTMQEERKEQLEQLGQERAEAEKTAGCAHVKLSFANIFSFGIAGAAGYGAQMNAEYDAAMQKVATIDLQTSGLIGIPAPQLSPELKEVLDAFSSHDHAFNFGAQPKDLARQTLDRLNQEGRLDAETYTEVNQLINEHSTGDIIKNGEVGFFKDLMLLQARQDAGQPQEAGVSTGASAAASTEATGNAADDAAWLVEMSAAMNAQQEEMNKVISELEEAQQAVVGAAQDGQDLAAFRMTTI